MRREKCYLVMITCPGEEEARAIQQALVFERLAACVTLLPGVSSCYRWQDKIEQTSEVMLLAKTREGRFGQLRERVLQLHPDQVPEIVALAVEEGEERYLDWVRENT